MSSSQVTSASFATESSRARTILSRWAVRIAERRRLSTPDSENPEDLIQKTTTRQRRAREKAFGRHLPFSWIRFFAGVVSLLLVFSDVFRGGAGVKSLQKAYPAIQPDQVLGFGTTWHYSVFSATKDEAVDKTALVWTYKFDSTSISWRAFARHFDVKAFPDCFYYVETCRNEFLSGIHAFDMIDSLVTAISADNSSAQTPMSYMLRTENEYIDRLHQFLLPNWFKNVNWRTNQALYYSAELLKRSNARSICFPANGSKMRTPRFCKRIWINLKRSCAPSDTEGQAVGLLYVHAMKRLHDIQTRFPDLSVDLTFLESQEDMQVNKGGLSSLGFGRSDVATIIRARDCRIFPCETVFIDEYRYETGLLTSDVIQWYRLIATLRFIGQLYFWLRGIGLMLSCYFVFQNPTEDKSFKWIQLRKARHLFMKTPTQSVVYGSPFPILCYVLAHFLDAPYTYQVLESHFFSQAGVVDIKPESFVSYAVVQMRSVWVYALIWQSIMILTRFTTKNHTNRLNSGLVGVPEFLLSIFSYVTLLAQYRMTSIRSAKILRIMEFPSNIGSAWEAVKYVYSFSRRGRGNTLLGGVLIDLKFLICFGFFVAVWWAVYLARVRLWAAWKKEDKHRYSHWYLLPPTPVPYSAGILWPSVSMCVHWTRDFYCIQENQSEEPELLQIVKKKQYRTRHSRVARLLWWRTGDARVLAINSIQAKYHPDAEIRRHTRKTTDTYRYIQHQMECLHSRSDDVEANVAFINAVLLSDPLVYFRVVFGGEKVAYYQSIWCPKQIVLLPVAVVGEHNECIRGLKLLRLVHISELSWAELVQCG